MIVIAGAIADTLRDCVADASTGAYSTLFIGFHGSVYFFAALLQRHYEGSAGLRERGSIDLDTSSVILAKHRIC
jgi:hypothetical protein